MTLNPFRTFSLLLPLLLLFSSAPADSPADSTASGNPPGTRDGALRVYLDCGSCDNDFIRSEITFVNHVRDRHDAHVIVLVTTQRSGSGGKVYTATFVGRDRFAGENDTLSYTVTNTDTDAFIRSEMVRVMKLGLVRYAARTPVARTISIGYDAVEADGRVADPWDGWVFKSSLNSYLNGEQFHDRISLYGNVSASRITPDVKVRVEGWGNYTEDRFDIDGERLLSLSSGYGGETFAVWSVDDHWSFGGDVTVSTSSFANRRISVSAGPALEYNVFPYGESTRRQFRFSLMPVYSYVRYSEETIFDRTLEHRVQTQLSAALEMRQPWGSVEFQVEGSLYLHDPRKNRVRFSAETSLPLVSGLSFEVDGNVSMIHDQLSLPKSGASTEEILLQRRQLATQYQYYLSIGLSYTFGSIFNNVVNPRFGDF